jgi:hypothetical protein
MISERRVYKGTAVLWLAAVLAHLAWYLLPFALGTVPPVPKGEVYFANDVTFQAIVFVFTFLPFWCAGLVIAVFAELAVFRFVGKRRSSSGSANAGAP